MECIRKNQLLGEVLGVQAVTYKLKPMVNAFDSCFRLANFAVGADPFIAENFPIERVPQDMQM